MAVESVNPYANYLTRDNIAVPASNPLPDSLIESIARADIDARLTGDFAGGRVVASGESAAGDASAEVIEVQDGSADSDQTDLILLPEDVSGTFVLTIAHSGDGGTPDATTALDLDASAATVQAAVDVVTGTANEIVVQKATDRRAFTLTWSHANEDLTDHAPTTVAVTETGERGLTVAQEPAA